MIQFQENTQTDKRTDGRIDERLFHRALPATAWSQKKKKKKKICHCKFKGNCKTMPSFYLYSHIIKREVRFLGS